MPSENENANQVNEAEAKILEALSTIIKNATSPEVFEAQTILLRRLALQGDVINSRVPAPLNITEIGGYINLLETLNQPEMRAQMLAGILGVAGPNPPLGWLSSKPALSILTIANDRPEGPAQPSIPVTFAIRSDFFSDVLSALKTLHDKKCALPLLSSYFPLPKQTPGAVPPEDALPYLGRTFGIVPAAALRDPENDPIALARPAGSTDDYQIVARALKAESVVPASNWEALKCDATSCTPIAVANVKYLPLKPILATAGFYPLSPLPVPATKTEITWTRFNNITGLIEGVTKLGDELTQLYSIADVSNSVFAACLNWVWNGDRFAATTNP